MQDHAQFGGSMDIQGIKHLSSTFSGFIDLKHLNKSA